MINDNIYLWTDFFPYRCLQLIENTHDTSTSFFKTFSQYTWLLSLLFVIIGWCVVYYNAKRLATRSETKSLIDGVISITSELEKLTIDYWLSGRKTRIGTEEFLLISSSKIESLGSRLKIIQRRGINITSFNLSKISMYMTLNCENVDQSKPENNRIQMQNFLSELNQSIENIYDEFHRNYRPIK
ncbi:hypothetical protein [Photobacterium phosphoreum]|uniref:hypothetical protein n=1 Tax=Photobacterium phosphoreum TaxID=659 RepID=UPI001E32D487|nr:hypothetical protein [Photobacterium phosphoreum]MCD9506559.1 hypothetical protein [Photobacterium phosphoreum]